MKFPKVRFLILAVIYAIFFMSADAGVQFYEGAKEGFERNKI